VSHNVGGTGLSAERLRELGLDHLIPREPSPLEVEHAEQQLVRRRKLGEPLGLSPEQVAYCEANNFDLERYAAFAGTSNLDDFQAAADSLATRAAAARLNAIDAERRRQKRK
jgi:hypothetical protein